MKKNNKTISVTSSSSVTSSTSISTNKQQVQKNIVEIKIKGLCRDASNENFNIQKKSPKKSKHLDGKSPTKKSQDYLNKLDQDYQDDEDVITSPGNRKFTRDISDVAGKKLPHIPEYEILEFTTEENLTEAERPTYGNFLKIENSIQRTQNYQDEENNKNELNNLVNEKKFQELQEYQKSLQDEIFPLIFGSWLQEQTEYIQILVGEAFLILLKCDQTKFNHQVKHLEELRKDSIIMLQQWSSDILEIWTEVYSLTLSLLVKHEQSQKKIELQNDCKSTVFRMSDCNQAIKVRIKAASLLGYIAKYDSLGDMLLFQTYFLSKLRQLCQDLHWEVRKEMCTHLIYISQYIGSKKSEEFVLPELKELLEDEEGEVVTEAAVQFQKHLSKIFSGNIVQSNETTEIFLKICDHAENYSMTMVDLAKILKIFPKLIACINRPNDKKIQQKILKLFNKAIQNGQEEDVKAILPFTFEGICYVYDKNIYFLLQFYEQIVQDFVQDEIESGTPNEKQIENDFLPKSIYYDVIEKEKNKYKKENLEDQNFIVNRSIAQNLHFFFGVFINYLENIQNCDEKTFENQDMSPLSPKIKINQDTPKFRTNHQKANIITEKLQKNIINILQNYQSLLKTKDQELMHHVLFSFYNYHKIMTRIEVWQGVIDLQAQKSKIQDNRQSIISNQKDPSLQINIISDEIRDLYLDIVKNDIVRAEQIVQNCWRYHMTYLKVLETIFESNDTQNLQAQSDKQLSINPKIKSFSQLVLQADVLQQIFMILCPQILQTNLVQDNYIQPKVKCSILKGKSNANQNNTSNQVKLQCCSILANILTTSKKQKIRQKIIDFFQKLQKSKQLGFKSIYLNFLEILIKEKKISSITFKRNYYQNLLLTFEDSSTVYPVQGNQSSQALNIYQQNGNFQLGSIQLKILRDIMPHVFKLIFDEKYLVDQILIQINYLKNKCENIVKLIEEKQRGCVYKLIIEEIQSLYQFYDDPDSQDQMLNYLQNEDKIVMQKEEQVTGNFVQSTPSLTPNINEYFSYQNKKYLGQQSIQQLPVNHNQRQKKMFSVRSFSKQGNRQQISQNQNLKEKKIQQYIQNNLSNSQNKEDQRPSSLRPPTQPILKRQIQLTGQQQQIISQNQFQKPDKSNGKTSPQQLRKMMQSKYCSQNLKDEGLINIIQGEIQSNLKEEENKSNTSQSEKIQKNKINLIEHNFKSDQDKKISNMYSRPVLISKEINQKQSDLNEYVNSTNTTSDQSQINLNIQKVEEQSEVINQINIKPLPAFVSENRRSQKGFYRMFRKQTSEEDKSNLITPIQNMKQKSSYHKPLNNNIEFKHNEQKQNTNIDSKPKQIFDYQPQIKTKENQIRPSLSKIDNNQENQFHTRNFTIQNQISKNPPDQIPNRNDLKENIDQRNSDILTQKNNFKNQNSQIKMMFGSDFKSQKTSGDTNQISISSHNQMKKQQPNKQSCNISSKNLLINENHTNDETDVKSCPVQHILTLSPNINDQQNARYNSNKNSISNSKQRFNFRQSDFQNQKFPQIPVLKVPEKVQQKEEISRQEEDSLGQSLLTRELKKFQEKNSYLNEEKHIPNFIKEIKFENIKTSQNNFVLTRKSSSSQILKRQKEINESQQSNQKRVDSYKQNIQKQNKSMLGYLAGAAITGNNPVTSNK